MEKGTRFASVFNRYCRLLAGVGGRATAEVARRNLRDRDDSDLNFEASEIEIP